MKVAPSPIINIYISVIRSVISNSFRQIRSPISFILLVSITEYVPVCRRRNDSERQLSVAVVNERYGAFSELDPVDIGEDTDVVEEHNTDIIDSECTDAGSD
jgi:hypothetical protein